MVGWLDRGLRGQKGNNSHIFFPIYASITIGMGVIFLIANRGNKQINKPLRLREVHCNQSF